MALALENAMAFVRARFPDALFAVCLSGGLDSSAVAESRQEDLREVVAVSFSLLSENDVMARLNGSRPEDVDSISEDFLNGRRS